MKMVKRVGLGAVCSAPLHLMKPSKVIKTKYPNTLGRPRIEQLLALRKEVRSLNNKPQVCIVFRHDDFPNEELYCHQRFCRVEQEGPLENVFGEVDEVEGVDDEHPTVEVPGEVSGSVARSEDAFCAMKVLMWTMTMNQPLKTSLLPEKSSTTSRHGDGVEGAPGNSLVILMIRRN
ncbi:hypothetical protein IV203_036913 [Nitzschia inconspicua]|uniref:Uncharacterized protein n=1 Tax=Nitzschia inconspicua TaxID=303405 RepID=A0A9K3PVZ9_9STRA|nr:hypothetical protein IV203_036913 [Nitzschia inconspicua]